MKVKVYFDNAEERYKIYNGDTVINATEVTINEVAIDEQLSDTSANAVENRAVKKALDDNKSYSQEIVGSLNEKVDANKSDTDNKVGTLNSRIDEVIGQGMRLIKGTDISWTWTSILGNSSNFQLPADTVVFIAIPRGCTCDVKLNDVVFYDFGNIIATDTQVGIFVTGSEITASDNFSLFVNGHSEDIKELVEANTTLFIADSPQELKDIRVDYYGVTHASAGDSVRSIMDYVEKYKQDIVTSKAKGNEITINNCADSPIKAISIMGKSTQEGTPTIDNPIPIVDITSEEIEVTDGTNTQTAELNLTLRGIPVASGGNYTDNDGQEWICDTIEKYPNGAGKYIQRVGVKVFDGSETWTDGNNPIVYTSIPSIPNSNKNSHTTLFTLSNKLQSYSSQVNTIDNSYLINNGILYISPTQNGVRLNATQFKSYLASNNATLLYKLDTPIETPLTAEQLAELSLRTYYPVTEITSNTDIDVEYVYSFIQSIEQKQDKLNAGENVSIIDNVISANLPYLTDFINMADMVKRVKAGGKNFVWNTLDKGYLTIVFDDGNNDLSTVADIFAEYNIPLCVAMIPDKLENISDDGRTIKQVCDDIVSNGGEVLAHERTVLTSPTDYSTIKTILMDAKQKLVNAGYDVRGVTMPGGTEAIDWRGNNLQRFTQLFYDYASYCGDDPQYYLPRKGISSVSIDVVKGYIDDAITNNKWLICYAHELVHTPEERLRAVIEYGIAQGIEFKTYAYMYDNFGTWE